MKSLNDCLNESLQVNEEKNANGIFKDPVLKNVTGVIMDSVDEDDPRLFGMDDSDLDDVKMASEAAYGDDEIWSDSDWDDINEACEQCMSDQNPIKLDNSWKKQLKVVFEGTYVEDLIDKYSYVLIMTDPGEGTAQAENRFFIFGKSSSDPAFKRVSKYF